MFAPYGTYEYEDAFALAGDNDIIGILSEEPQQAGSASEVGSGRAAPPRKDVRIYRDRWHQDVVWTYTYKPAERSEFGRPSVGRHLQPWRCPPQESYVDEYPWDDSMWRYNGDGEHMLNVSTGSKSRMCRRSAPASGYDMNDDRTNGQMQASAELCIVPPHSCGVYGDEIEGVNNASAAGMPTFWGFARDWSMPNGLEQISRQLSYRRWMSGYNRWIMPPVCRHEAHYRTTQQNISWMMIAAHLDALRGGCPVRKQHRALDFGVDTIYNLVMTCDLVRFRMAKTGSAHLGETFYHLGIDWGDAVRVNAPHDCWWPNSPLPKNTNKRFLIVGAAVLRQGLLARLDALICTQRRSSAAMQGVLASGRHHFHNAFAHVGGAANVERGRGIPVEDYCRTWADEPLMMLATRMLYPTAEAKAIFAYTHETVHIVYAGLASMLVHAALAPTPHILGGRYSKDEAFHWCSHAICCVWARYRLLQRMARQIAARCRVLIRKRLAAEAIQRAYLDYKWKPRDGELNERNADGLRAVAEAGYATM